MKSSPEARFGGGGIRSGMCRWVPIAEIRMKTKMIAPAAMP